VGGTTCFGARCTGCNRRSTGFDAFDGLFLCLTPPLAGGSAGHPRPDPYLLRPGGFAQSCVLAPEGRTNPHRPHGSRSQVRVKPHTSRERIRHPCKKVPGPPSNRSPLEPIERAGMGPQLRLAFSADCLVPLAGPATGTDQRHSANRLFLLCKTAECNGKTGVRQGQNASNIMACVQADP